MQTELTLPLWLIILIGVLVGFAIIACIYKIFTYRRMSIVAKKADYLIEDLIYKSEYVTPSIEALVKLTSYADIANDFLNKNSNSLIKLVSKNKKNLEEQRIIKAKEIKEIIEKKQEAINKAKNNNQNKNKQTKEVKDKK